MTRFRIPAGAVPLAAALTGLVLAGCGSDTPATVSTSSTAPPSAASADPHAAFDPCTAITADLIETNGWDRRPPKPESMTRGEITWKGCTYLADDGYGLGVETTTATIEQIRDQYPTVEPLTVSGRSALRYEATPDTPGGCNLNVEMSGGSLEFTVNVPQTSAREHLVPCDIALTAAEQVVPLLSPDA